MATGPDIATAGAGTTRATLDALLDAARSASLADRIRWRDPIAAHGLVAIPAMRRWIEDPQLGAFAVRVLERMAHDPSARSAAIAALRDADPSPGALVERDIIEALARLTPGTRSSAGAVARPRVTPVQWSGYASASPIEQRFHDAMLDIFRLAGEATRKRRPDGTVVRGYWAQYFLRGVRNHGGLVYAKRLLAAAGTSDGFTRLTQEGRLDLTMEALVLRPEFASLFTAREIQTAASRLARFGYQA